jgi:N-acetylglucosaminyldiphosphoundecaprenol N-acetyl-beta-D-mannosaminyltransferase
MQKSSAQCEGLEPGTHAHVDVLGVKVSAINMQMALSTIEAWIGKDERQYVCITGVHGVMESQKDEELLAVHNAAGMVTPDGMPLVWISRLKGCRHVRRVYGPDLMLEVCRISVRRGYRHFFYGGKEGVPELLAARLTEEYPGLSVAGTYSPPFRTMSEEEDKEIVGLINHTRPNVVWVGLSTPKQEQWMATHVHRVQAQVLIGVGAAFDFHAGLKPQAPRWMQTVGLEWLFRTITEPRRLGSRYLKNNPAFLWNLAMDQFWYRQDSRPQEPDPQGADDARP